MEINAISFQIAPGNEKDMQREGHHDYICEEFLSISPIGNKTASQMRVNVARKTRSISKIAIIRQSIEWI
jgi:hypothetical protein